nr:MAG TPA: hypothetical protein [Caudoviricetes sp.]
MQALVCSSRSRLYRCCFFCQWFYIYLRAFCVVFVVCQSFFCRYSHNFTLAFYL